MSNIKDSLIKEMESYFGEDIRRINHARRVTAYAEELLQTEGGDYQVVIGAAVLHDIGIHEAERKHGSTSGKYQEMEGPPIARPILEKLGFTSDQVREICDIIGHHHTPGKVNTRNFYILSDADWLVNLGDDFDIRDKEKISKIIEKAFLTANGKALARKIYLENSSAD